MLDREVLSHIPSQLHIRWDQSRLKLATVEIFTSEKWAHDTDQHTAPPHTPCCPEESVAKHLPAYSSPTGLISWGWTSKIKEMCTWAHCLQPLVRRCSYFESVHTWTQRDQQIGVHGVEGCKVSLFHLIFTDELRALYHTDKATLIQMLGILRQGNWFPHVSPKIFFPGI